MSVRTEDELIEELNEKCLYKYVFTSDDINENINQVRWTPGSEENFSECMNILNDLVAINPDFTNSTYINESIFNYCSVNNLLESGVNHGLNNDKLCIDYIQNYGSKFMKQFETYCDPDDVNLRNMKPNVCTCFDSRYNSEAAYNLDTLCSNDSCDGVAQTPSCVNSSCSTQNQLYHFYSDVHCPDIQNCNFNIEDNSTLDAGVFYMVCSMGDDCSLEQEECQALCDELIQNTSEGTELPPYCYPCANEESQTCYNSLNIPCQGPNHIEYPQCLSADTSCHVMDPGISCTSNKYCFEDIPGSNYTTNTDPYRDLCNVDFDNPDNPSVSNDICHVSRPPQECYDYIDRPCDGPVNTTINDKNYWQCSSTLPSSCYVMNPPQSCYTQAGKPCEYPGVKPAECDTIVSNCYGGPNCVCTESNIDTENKSIYTNKDNYSVNYNVNNKDNYKDNYSLNNKKFNVNNKDNYSVTESSEMSDLAVTDLPGIHIAYKFMYILITFIICIIILVVTKFSGKGFFISLIVLLIAILIYYLGGHARNIGN